MNITLTSKQEQFIQAQISKGKYTDLQEIIDSALTLLEKQEQDYEQWLDETRQKVQLGLQQLARGEKVDGEVVITQLQEKLKRMREENFS
jgi:antitoxin ParD1/3/4